MANNRNRRVVAVVMILILLALMALLLSRCPRTQPTPAAPEQPQSIANNGAPTPSPAATQPVSTEPDEVLTPAMLIGPSSIAAGSTIRVSWTGPNNPRDYITIADSDAPAESHLFYNDVKHGSPLDVTAPIEPGAYELRYIAGRSRTILGRASVDVLAVEATLDAPEGVIIGSSFEVIWTGPNNDGDFITIVASDAPNDRYASYADADGGSPQSLTAPTSPGEYQVRYVTGQERRVLARRAISVKDVAATLVAPSEAVAGSTIEVTWTGPDASGDYITVVPRNTPDGQYGNYVNASSGSPIKLLMPITSGEAEIRYMTGQGHRVLGRRSIAINAATIALDAPAECTAGSEVTIVWTGPNHGGDYITIVPKSLPDGQFAAYANTSSGSPLKVKAPANAGDAEIRYMSGQGSKVLARRSIRIAS